MRQLVLNPVERGLADQLRHGHLDRLPLVVVALREEHRAFRHMGDQPLSKQHDVITRPRGQRNHLGPLEPDLLGKFGNLCQTLRKDRPAHRVGLRHDRDDGLAAQMRKLSGNEAISRTNRLIGRDAQADHVDT